MRPFSIATILVCLLALSPQATSAHPPGGYGGYGYYYGHGYGYYGPGYGYGYYNPAVPYVVARPIIEEPVFSGLPIKITNPATTGVTLSYTLNDVSYSIPPGYSQDLVLDRSWVIGFGRGGNFGTARYGLEAGQYTFANTDHGWELFHGALPKPGVVQAPSATQNPTPPATAPAPPPPPAMTK